MLYIANKTGSKKVELHLMLYLFVFINFSIFYGI